MPQFQNNSRFLATLGMTIVKGSQLGAPARKASKRSHEPRGVIRQKQADV
jgi:hypothetical protein